MATRSTRGLASGIAGSQAFFQKVPSSAGVFLPNGKAPEAGELVQECPTTRRR